MWDPRACWTRVPQNQQTPPYSPFWTTYTWPIYKSVPTVLPLVSMWRGRGKVAVKSANTTVCDSADFRLFGSSFYLKCIDTLVGQVIKANKFGGVVFVTAIDQWFPRKTSLGELIQENLTIGPSTMTPYCMERGNSRVRMQMTTWHGTVCQYINLNKMWYAMETLFPRLVFARGIHRSTVDSPNTGPVFPIFMFSWYCPEQAAEQKVVLPLIGDAKITSL